MTEPKPYSSTVEFEGYKLSYKGYLKKSHSFSYRCKNYYSCNCPFLLTVPINNNYDTKTWNCISFKGATRASTRGHSDLCNKRINTQLSRKLSLELLTDDHINDNINTSHVIEWKSDISLLRDFIRQNPFLGPKTIQSEMRLHKQEFTLRSIQDTKKEICNELFPKDRRVAFHPTNCLCLEATDNHEDNIFKFGGQFMAVSKCRKTNVENLNQHEFYIFANHTMLKQLEASKQWFIDGTFKVAPMGFQQLLTIIVYLPDLKLFYPACFIIATSKSEVMYNNCFRSLVGVAEDEGFKLDPQLIMSDFETGLQNSIKRIFNGEDKLVGCYFHYVKALIQRAKKTGLLGKNQNNKFVKIMIGLLKLLAHTPNENRISFFEEIESLFLPLGKLYEDYMTYYAKNWLKNDFLENLYKAYCEKSDISFVRTNNPCELFNKYLNQVFEVTKPSPGYFIKKIKKVEFNFLGQYLSKCRGKGRKRKSNLEKNPLENLTLPNLEILNLCIERLREYKYDLRSLKNNEDFIKKIEDLVDKYLDSIEFRHLKTQNEQEKAKIDDLLNLNEEEKQNENINAQSDQPQEKDEEEVEEFEEDDEEKNYKKKVIASKKKSQKGTLGKILEHSIISAKGDMNEQSQ